MLIMVMMNTSVTRKFVPWDINKKTIKQVCLCISLQCVCKYMLLLLAGGSVQM